MNKRPKCSDVDERLVLAAIRELRRTKGESGTPDQVLADRYPPKLVHAKLLKLCKAGYIDFGTSMRAGWLTPEGEVRLAELESR